MKLTKAQRETLRELATKGYPVKIGMHSGWNTRTMEALEQSGSGHAGASGPRGARHPHQRRDLGERWDVGVGHRRGPRGGDAVSRHHRRLLRRLRAEWSSRGAAVSLRRDPGADGRWRVSVVPYWSAVDGRRVVALQLALRLTRDHCRVGLL